MSKSMCYHDSEPQSVTQTAKKKTSIMNKCILLLAIVVVYYIFTAQPAQATESTFNAINYPVLFPKCVDYCE
jgi:hypothetical protein